jgi:DNA-binding NarL/FixJ family response regulator
MLMDIAMPVMNGIGAAAQIRDLCPAVSVIMLSMHATSEHIYRSLQAGARGYLLKDSAGAELVEAVKRVHGGERYLARAISDTLIDGYLRDYCRNVKPGGDGRAASVDWRKR